MLWMARLAAVSVVVSILAVKASDQIVDAIGGSDSVSRVARPVVGVGSFTAATAGVGMGGVKSKIRSLRRRHTGVLKALTKRAGK